MMVFARVTALLLPFPWEAFAVLLIRRKGGAGREWAALQE